MIMNNAYAKAMPPQDSDSGTAKIEECILVTAFQTDRDATNATPERQPAKQQPTSAACF